MGTAALRWAEALHERGHEVDVVVPAVKGSPAAHPLIRPWPVAFAWGNGAVLRDMRGLWEGVDLLHLHLPFYGVQEFLLAQTTPKPCVATFHMDAMPRGPLGLAVRLHQRILQPALFRRISRFFASSLDYVGASSAAKNWQCTPERWEELPFFVDTQAFHPAPHSSGPQLQALFVSVLDRAHQFKGLAVLFAALQQVNDVHLTIIGEGEERPMFERMAVEMDLTGRVTFAGRVSDQVLKEAYQRADVVVSPSTSGAEAFGLVALEAQACGTPVIASALPGVRTVVRDGETGLLVMPRSVSALAEALRRMQDSAWRQSLGKNARAWVESRFQKEALVTQLERAYRDVVCGSP